MSDHDSIVGLTAENALLRLECARLHLALTQAHHVQRTALDGWASAWDAYRRLADDVCWLRQELGRLRPDAVRTPRRTQETSIDDDGLP